MRIKVDEIIDKLPGSCKNLIKDRLFKLGRTAAQTGKYSDECLELGYLPVAVHFYQPIPDIKELEKRKVWDKKSKLSGLNFNDDEFKKLLDELSEFSDECDWPNDPTDNPYEFFLNNNCFSYGCASMLHTMIRKNKPKRIIEVGSGNSSRIISKAMELNDKDGHTVEEYVLIDPYTTIETDKMYKNTEVLAKPVETLEPEFFQKLEENDILFIDSSHVCKIGSDVNFEILDVLPILNKGVYIHIHDIALPYEYPKVYATNPAFRMFWTEQYLLQAFLSCNDKFKTIMPMNYVQMDFPEYFREKFPKGNNAQTWNSSSYWIKKVD